MKFRFLIILFLTFLGSVQTSGQTGGIMAKNLQDSILSTDLLIAAGDSMGIGSEDVPNIFTPNGDKINDQFIVKTPAGRVYEFTIFTRTGTMIYYSKSPSIFWDGRNSGGIEVPEGIYYYVIELADNASSKGISGFIYLFR